MQHKDSPWPAADDTLRRLWGEGATAAVIAEQMRLTKNAVVGRAHRLGLSARPSPIRRAPEGAAPKPPKPPRAPKVTLPPLAAEPSVSAVSATPERAPAPPKPPRPSKAAPPAPAAAPPPPPAAPTSSARCEWPTWTVKDAAYWSALRAGAPPACGQPAQLRQADDGAWVACPYCPEHALRARGGHQHGYASNRLLATLAAAPPDAHAPWAKARAHG